MISGGKDHNNSGDDHSDWEYRTTGSVITDGVNNNFSPPLPSSGNSPQMTISGGYHNRVYGRMGVTTGEKSNGLFIGINTVVLGGRANNVNGNYATILGGFQNTASGDVSSLWE